MTPERKEEIKLSHEYMTKRLESYPQSALIRANDDIADLLAALEEAEQHYAETEEQLAKTFDSWLGQLKIIGEANKESDLLKAELAEAQQTIARQREALEFYARDYNHEFLIVEGDKGTIARAALWEGAKES